MFLWIPLAHAASVAVLDFDAQGQGFSTAQRAAEALRAALLEEHLLEPLSARDIADGVSAGRDTPLRLGRQKMAEARRLRASGDVVGCAARAGEAGDLLAEAWSDVGRRTELADAWFLQGACLSETGNEVDAAFAFAEVTRQHPGYLGERAEDLAPGMVEALARAQAAADAAGPRRRPPERLATIGAALGVDYVVTGNLDRRGRLTVALYEDGTLRGEAASSVKLPPSAADPAFVALAHQLVDAAGLDLDEAADVPALDPAEVLRAEPEEDAPEPGAPSEQAVADRGPVERRWWIWTTLALVAGGGATAVALLTADPPPDPVQGPPTWSVHIPTD